MSVSGNLNCIEKCQNTFVYTMETDVFFHFENIINVIALSASFEYLSVADPEHPPFRISKTKKRPDFGQNMFQNAPF